MSTYKESGVDIEEGDKCSALAYKAAKATFESRKGMIGKPVVMDGGFSGALDFGDFYLIQNCDGVGSKMAVADLMRKYDTMGYDLLAMVVDDAVCVGAETVAITNTIDTSRVSKFVIGSMMKGLEKACLDQKVVIPGGEIAEIPDQVKGNMWNSTALGIVEKSKFITGKGVKAGDKIIGLSSRGFRSNGFSLVRYVLKNAFGDEWYMKPSSVLDKKNWGDAVLTPSLIYSGALLELLGRYGKKRKCEIKALAHVTGGGIPGNITRVLGGLGAELDSLQAPHDVMLKLQEIGKVSDREAYKTWNMGVGMILISDEFDTIARSLKKHGIHAQIIGSVKKNPSIELTSRGFEGPGKILKF